MVFLKCTSDFGILWNKILCKFHFEREHLCSYIWHMSFRAHLLLHPHLYQKHLCPTHAALHFSLFPGPSWMSHNFIPLHNARAESTFLNLRNAYRSFQTQPSPQNLKIRRLFSALCCSPQLLAHPPFCVHPHAPLHICKVSNQVMFSSIYWMSSPELGTQLHFLNAEVIEINVWAQDGC